MDFKLTPEQQAIVDADLRPQSVIACPGSGKTSTAVRRLLEVRRRLGDARGHVLLLSYSNVAVETFQVGYAKLASGLPEVSSRVRIETVDSFITSFVLRPHGSRIMGAPRQAFLVTGSEAFLANFKVFDGKYPRDIDLLTFRLDAAGDVKFYISENGIDVPIDRGVAEKAITRLGKTGAYTHELGRYWAVMALHEEERLLKALSRRFPQIIVDEAQDVGLLHATLLDMLRDAGSVVSLIGDPNQAIFEFAGADGTFLREYGSKEGVQSYPLTQNRRSFESIVDVANKLAGVTSSPVRKPDERRSGAFYVKCDPKKPESVAPLFEAILTAHGYDIKDAAILCRGRPLVAKLIGSSSATGTGATHYFARAAISRDRAGDISSAFEDFASGLLRLVEDPPFGLRSDVVSNADDPQARNLRRLAWAFLRDQASGLPSAALRAESQWHPRLKASIEKLLADLEAATSLKRLPTWTRNLTKRDLLDAPLWQGDLMDAKSSQVRIDTVHKAKGESITAVMYLTKTDDLNAMLLGTGNEEGRIGYVAATRAKDLFILGVPVATKEPVLKLIESVGISAWVY